ncbi:FlhC family transcriptional regulator [Marinobacter alkaliphilus]|uniref:FlhC family transcriptional regulator n=1 Tax=Marinobacter alkaliphilus TaxID=254719 RepID=A0ABZ3E974_9GAMM
MPPLFKGKRSIQKCKERTVSGGVVNQVDAVKIYIEYIRYGARRSTAQRISGISTMQSKQIYLELMGEPPKGGRNTTTWKAIVGPGHQLAIPAQKFLGAYLTQCGERIYSSKQIYGVLEAYKAYLAIHSQDPVILSLDKAYFIASCLWDGAEEAHVSSCLHCAATFPSLYPMADQCHVCAHAESASGFSLKKRRSRASVRRLTA